MDPISAILAGGLNSRLDSLNVLANNLSNASSTGYKADRERFAAYLSAEAASWLEDANQDAAVQTPVVEDRYTDFRQGALLETGNPAHCALEGPGFFAVETPRGLRYTRSGHFQIASDGELRTREGFRVRSIGTEKPGRLLADPSKAVDVAPNGDISQEGRVLGRLDRVDFLRPDLLQKEEGAYFRAPAGLKEQPAGSAVVGGNLEASNVDSAVASYRLIETTRQFGLLQRAFGLQDGLQRGLIERVAKW